MAEEVFIPKLGQTVEEVTLVKWLVADGTKVAHGQEIMEVETDKAVFPVEANAKGYLHRGPYGEGEVLPVLTVVAIIGAESDKFEVKSAPAGEAEGQALPAVEAPLPGVGGQQTSGPAEVFASPRARKLALEKEVDLAQVKATGGGGVRVAERDVIAYLAQAPKATPLAKKMAAEAGVDLREVPGTGPRGKIVKDDVARVAVPAKPVAPVPAAAPLPEAEVVERVSLKGVRGIIAERMGTSAHTTAHVTLFMEVDATEFVAVRNRLKERVEKEWGFAPGYNDLLAKIVVTALRKFPNLNARLAPDAIELLGHVNLGMAVDTERGLLVPVIHDADRKSLQQFGAEFREMAERARIGRSLPDDLSGGTFTITNLGMYDVDAFTPIINLPEAAILGVGRIGPKPVALGDQVVIRQRWNLCLVFDHRLVDGAPAARFLQYIKQLIEEPYLLIAV
jgi:pyruvate dehydrogenase E2 component (dihydrolipoamide acetyltransferase)